MGRDRLPPARASMRAMRVAYLVNQHPKMGHVFIRREILAVEGEGCEVTRYSLRRTGDELIDPLDREDASRTQLAGAGGVDALVDGVRQIFDAPLGQLVEMGSRAREDVCRQHEIGNIARGMVAHFRDAIEGKSSGAVLPV